MQRSRGYIYFRGRWWPTVSFTDFVECSLDILVYYFTKSIDWLTYMDVRQRINCAMMRVIEARGLPFDDAQPTSPP